MDQNYLYWKKVNTRLYICAYIAHTYNTEIHGLLAWLWKKVPSPLYFATYMLHLSYSNLDPGKIYGNQRQRWNLCKSIKRTGQILAFERPEESQEPSWEFPSILRCCPLSWALNYFLSAIDVEVVPWLHPWISLERNTVDPLYPWFCICEFNQPQIVWYCNVYWEILACK